MGAILVLLPLLIDGGKAVTKESNIIDIWESSKDTSKYPTPKAWYDTVKTCQIKEVCSEDSENCGEDKIEWKGIADFLKNSLKVKEKKFSFIPSILGEILQYDLKYEEEKIGQIFLNASSPENVC